MKGAMFEKYNLVTLEPLRKMGKRPARQVLENFGTLSKFAIDYIMLTALGAHAIPLNDKMITYLKDYSLVHPDATPDEIEGFLCRQITSSKAYEFYALLRSEAESPKIASQLKKKVVKKQAAQKADPKTKKKKTKRTKKKKGKK